MHKNDYRRDGNLIVSVLTGQSPSGKFEGSVTVNLKTPPL